jgi:hypothetical protein
MNFDISEKYTASPLSVTEYGSGGCSTDGKKRQCQLHGKVARNLTGVFKTYFHWLKTSLICFPLLKP